MPKVYKRGAFVNGYRLDVQGPCGMLWLAFPEAELRKAFLRMYPGIAISHRRGRGVEIGLDSLDYTQRAIRDYFPDFDNIWDAYVILSYEE